MNIEQTVNEFLNHHAPGLKVVVKRCYQLAMYTFSHKIKSEGSIRKVSPDDTDYEYFFGYYDKSPWDRSCRYMLCMRAKDTWSDPDPVETADILLLDTKENSFRKLATTHTWNVQQGCMAQWLGPNFNNEIVYNDLRDGKYCSVVLNVNSMEERILPLPVYTVSNDGAIALSLDFSRLHRLRKGYGYAALPEATSNEMIPDSTCIWKMDMNTGEVKEVLKYTDFVSFETRPEMAGAEHKVNHLMLSPNGKRFMVLHRWFNKGRKYTRLVTCNVDGTDMYNLNDANDASHCFWKNDNEILAFENTFEGGDGYYLMKDKTQEYTHLWKQFCNDGHPSYSPDRSLIVTDSYPNRARIADIKLLKDTDVEGKDAKVIARVFAPFKYDNDTRCDLHPRWSPDGKMVCFDSVFEGRRGLYVIDIK